MARTPRIKTAEAQIEPGIPDGHLVTLDNEQQIAKFESAMQHGLQAGTGIGRLQAFGFLTRVAEISLLKEFERVKKSKEYKDLEYLDANGNLSHVADLEEYCDVFLGKSYRALARDSQNYRLLGEELYERAEKLGLSSRDYQAIQALPEDDLFAAKQLIESAENKEQLIDAVEQLAIRSAQLRSENTELKADFDANQKVLADKSALIDQLQTKQKRIKPPTPDEIGAQLRSESSSYALEAEGLVRGSIRDGFIQLQTHALENNANHDEYMAGILAQLERCIAEVRGELGIKQTADGNPLPEWMQGNADITLATATAE